MADALNLGTCFIMDSENIAEAWIQLHHLPKESSERETLFWAWERLNDLVDSEPEAAWNVIQEIIALDQSDEILANVGAGSFEDLLAKHGARFIDRVESCARAHLGFRRMLGVVWKNEIPDEVWNRIKAIAPPSW
jgi:hypothetical protein